MTKIANVTLQTDFGWYQDAGATTPETMPSGENQEGKVFSWNPNSGLMELRHPKLFFGPMALTSVTGNMAISTSWTTLALAVPNDGIGQRGGMTAYPPKGRYGICGFVGVASSIDNLTIHLRVMQGTSESNPAQPNIAVGNPVVVGEGVGTIPKANYAYQVYFEATDIQYGGAPNHACEILVQACGDYAGGVALGSSGVTNIASRGRIQRWDGEFGTI
jgi:hypothetical protein